MAVGKCAEQYYQPYKCATQQEPDRNTNAGYIKNKKATPIGVAMKYQKYLQPSS
jgi:hypothetical protein